MTLAFRRQDLTPLLRALAPLKGSDERAKLNLEVRGDKLYAEATDGRVRVAWSTPLATQEGAREGECSFAVGDFVHDLKAGGAGVCDLEDRGKARAQWAALIEGHTPLSSDRAELFWENVHDLTAESAYDAGRLLTALAGVGGYTDKDDAKARPGIGVPFLVRGELYARDVSGTAFGWVTDAGGEVPDKRQLPRDIVDLPLDRTASVGLWWGPGHLHVVQGDVSWWLPLRLGDEDDEVTARESILPRAKDGPLAFTVALDVLVDTLKRLRSLSQGKRLPTVHLVVFENSVTLETPLDGDHGGVAHVPVHTVEGENGGVLHLAVDLLLATLAAHSGDVTIRRHPAGVALPMLLTSSTATSVLMPLNKGGTP